MRVTPHRGLSVTRVCANSGVVVLPTMMAPARRRAPTMKASRRNPVLMGIGAERGPMAGRWGGVFQCHGDTVQGPHRLSAGDGLGGGLSCALCLVVPDEGEAVELRVDLIDAGQAVGDHLDRRQLAAGDPASDLPRRAKREVEVNHL